ncbi:MAG: SigB/SigF/SigG family RNA polymerase sigma factor [Solirubrobacterales bacterium]|nr:SigB/SigF/SigG family RNA polymerase sigma factor [Solirubrobacterales bacterium]MBV9367056.1 SigB/SigF/SigG family RNA polymerase sigma factor [Solirubrobacterales bacterium]
MAVTTTTPRGVTRVSDEVLLDAYHADRDPRAREELVKRFLPFARKLALRYVHSREPLDDLVQVASVGLLNAIERFEPGRGKKFTSFAAPTIVGELKRHFRDKGWTVHVPRDLQERALAVSRHTERLSARLGRSPTLDELADALDCSIEQVMEAIDAAHNYHPASLDAPVANDGEDRCALAETLGDEDDGFELAEHRQALAASWSTLSDVEQEVLSLRLVQELTQREISQRIGCSQMHVSRLLRRSMVRLDAAAVAN